MKLLSILKKKQTSVDKLLKNDNCKKILDEFCRTDLEKTTALILIYEVDDGERKETYWKCEGMEPGQAILTLDQLHHRIQHEGLAKYD